MGNQLYAFRVPGTETSALVAHSASWDRCPYWDRPTFSSLTVSGGFCRLGGLSTLGGISSAATGTTSTFLGFVSSTAAEFSARLTVGGVGRLADGTNCLSGQVWIIARPGGRVLSYERIHDEDVLIGGSTITATAGFILRSRVRYIDFCSRGTTNVNVSLARRRHSGGLGIRLSGNDLLPCKSVPVGGIFWATGSRWVPGISHRRSMAHLPLYPSSSGQFSFARERQCVLAVLIRMGRSVSNGRFVDILASETRRQPRS